MTSSPSHRVVKRETIVNRLVVPSTRIFAATIILVTGAGVSAVFWKMPKANEHHALYHDELVTPQLAAVPLPSDSLAAVSPEEMQHIQLPTLDLMPIASGGAERYAQVYTPLPSLAVAMAQFEQNIVVPEKEESPLSPVVSPKFEPIREVIEEKPISIEPVSREFTPMPTSVSTTDRSDELQAAFHFVENSKVTHVDLSKDPIDVFPIASAPELQPLQPFHLDGLSPLLPLREMNLPQLTATVTQ